MLYKHTLIVPLKVNSTFDNKVEFDQTVPEGVLTDWKNKLQEVQTNKFTSNRCLYNRHFLFLLNELML